MGKNIQEINKVLDFLRDEIPSTWKGHADFAVWLVKKLNPEIIVDLGVDRGFSTFVLASPQIGNVCGIDWFKGDALTGLRNTKGDVLTILKMLRRQFGINNIQILEGKFSEIAEKWKLPIDILHIDGSHDYKSVKRDYEEWSKFVKDDGVILFHDTNVPDDRYEVIKLFNEIDLPKFKFYHSFGLGVVSKNKSIIKEIKKKYGNVQKKQV